MDNVDKIRKDAITEIKEKVRKNPKFLHPINKERLVYQKKLKFDNGNEFTYWMQQVGIMKNSTNINSMAHKKTVENAECQTMTEYLNKCAQNAGFEDSAERKREWRYETGRQLPKEFNEYCPSYFGDFTEKLMIKRYPGAIMMNYGNRGFDYLWNEIKIDNKGGCLSYNNHDNWSGWRFQIMWNKIADRFALSGWDNRESLTPLYAWEFNKNDLVKKGNGMYAPKVEFCKRDGIAITYSPEGLEQFEDFQIDIDWLKELL